MENQILDDNAPVYESLKPFPYCGSVYGVIASERNHTGATVVDSSLKEYADAVSSHPGIERNEGYLGS